MIIQTINSKTFELYEAEELTGRLIYSNDSFSNGIIEASQQYILSSTGTGAWNTTLPDKKVICRTTVQTGGIISLRLSSLKTKYQFKKSAGWKLRFSLFHKTGDDILSIIPNVNWQKKSHDYILQLNEEFEKECDSFLILQSLHCANCCLSMMNGGKVPALVSI